MKAVSNPNPKAELHEAVEEYCNYYIGEPQEADYLHNEINHPEERTDRFNQFMEYINDL